MMEKIRKLVRRNDKEAGAADLIVTLATIPFAVMLILALIDVSLYMNTRSHVESAVRDGVRNAAMWGGSGSPSQVRLNTSGNNTAQNIKNRIWNGSNCIRSHCKQQPQVSCTTPVASQAGQRISCTVRYYNRSVVPGASLLGFGAITNAPFEASEFSISETGYAR